jgi:hypothetical protein
VACSRPERPDPFSSPKLRIRSALKCRGGRVARAIFRSIALRWTSKVGGLVLAAIFGQDLITHRVTLNDIHSGIQRLHQMRYR